MSGSKRGLSGYISSKKRQAKDYVQSWQSTAYSMVVFGATMVVIFWASVFLYTSFYFTFMPQESITWPIHFQFRSCGEQPGLCSNPSAVIPVLDPTRGSLLVRGQKYRVVVDLEMPESPVNQRIGMFLLNMEMRGQAGETMRQSSRSSMLRYKSSLLQLISTTVFAPLLLYGLQEEKQVVTVELFSQYEEDPLVPLSEVHIELASRHVELYTAQMRIHAMFSGLRYFMFQYPLSAAAVGVGICMVFLSAVVILSWYQFSGPALSPLQAQRGMAVSFPNGSASVITTNTASVPPPTPAKKVAEDETGDKVEAEETGGARVEAVEPDDETPDSQDLKPPTLHSATKEGSSSDSTSSEKSDRDDFEMVTPSKTQAGVSMKGEESSFPEPRRSTSSEGESVVRQRVQSVE